MNTPPAPNPPTLPAETARIVAAIFASLAAWVAHVFARHQRAAIVGPLWSYINRTAQRFARLMARFEAGTLRPHKPAAARPAREAKAERKPRLRLPTAKGWLGQDVGWYGRGYGSQLEHLLNQPETAALIASLPQAQRLLRPLCRMLGIAPACIPPLPRRPRVRKRVERTPKPRKPTRKELEAILWYSNIEGRPMRLLPRKIDRG